MFMAGSNVPAPGFPNRTSLGLFSFFSMLDPKLIRETPELVRAALAKKHLLVDLDAVLAVDAAAGSRVAAFDPKSGEYGYGGVAQGLA
jgi:hypothetical protein